MANKKYSNFIELNPKFESVIDIAADVRNANLWREYIVGDDMEKMMEVLCRSLNLEEPDSRRSFWIEGSYGAGKSYAAIMIKHLMEEPSDVVDAFLAQNGRLARYRNRFMKCRAKEKGDYLVVWKTGCTGILNGNALLMEAEKAIRDALRAKFGDKADYGDGDASLYDAVMKRFDSPLHNWEYILQNSELGDDYGCVEELRARLEEGDLSALQKTAAVIRRYGWGLVDSLETFQKWIASVIENNGLSESGIFFIWDEFTEYVAKSDDQTILQQLSEFCKKQPFFTLLVVHRTSEMVERITPERYQLITHRFHQVEFHISPDAAFDLIAGSINIRSGMNDHWELARKSVVNNIRKFLPDIVGLDDRISERIDDFCPMHPTTIKLLSRVAENYAASQRTMFRFMKDQSNTECGFAGYIDKKGPDDQACWLTPEWLWDYFFARESDFSDKDVKAADYIRHYEEHRNLVEKDEDALRVFKTALLLLALTSSTKGIYSGRRAKDGISATKDCLEACLAGVTDRSKIDDVLKAMVDGKILVLDEGAHDIVRIQLPFNGVGDSIFAVKRAANEKKYSRYETFSKDGELARRFEEQAWDPNDASLRRMKIAVCCAETNSIKNRLGEVVKELEKHPYKLGLLVVTTQSDAQASSIQPVLQAKAIEANEPRLTIALVKSPPFTDEKRGKWLDAVTKQEAAAETGQTGAAQQYKLEAAGCVNSWVSAAASGGKIVAYNGDRVFSGLYGMANLRKAIRANVQDEIFKYAPENVVVTNTAYKACNDAAATAGVCRRSNNSQLLGVLNSLKNAGVLDLKTIDEIVDAQNGGSKPAKCVAALAELARSEMESGRKVNLGDLWTTLQKPPFGYYNTVACGVLLGFVFSCYVNSKYTWTDSVQASHLLAEGTVSKMVSFLCGGKATTDYLSAGTVAWQNFSEYLAKIFNLSESQLADQTSGYQNVREAVIKTGIPFWALKRLPENAWNNKSLKEKADRIVDRIQTFIAQEGDVESAMSEALTLFHGSKIRVVLANAFQDKNEIFAAFRSFLFDASPELKDVATRLGVRREELNDRLHSVMQGAIYTWTEDQVKEKLADVTERYKYLEAVGKVQNKTYLSEEAAKKDLVNLFNCLRVPLRVVESLNKPWFSALRVLRDVAFSDVARLDAKEREAAIASLERYGAFATDCLRSGGKSILEDVLDGRDIECSQEELDDIYDGLQGLNYGATPTQFEKELNARINKISLTRNKSELLEIWRSISGTNAIGDWCNARGVPLTWIAPKELRGAFRALLAVQKGEHVAADDALAAISALRDMDATLLNDERKIEKALTAVVGAEYSSLLDSESKRVAVVAQAKFKIGSDMSAWTVADLGVLQGILKETLREKAKKEKLDAAKKKVDAMRAPTLKELVLAFLDEHPEYCDHFSK